MPPATDFDDSLQSAKCRLGEQLYYFRREQKLSLAELGHKTGFSPEYVDRLELGLGNANLTTLARLAAGLGKKIRIELTD